MTQCVRLIKKKEEKNYKKVQKVHQSINEIMLSFTIVNILRYGCRACLSLTHKVIFYSSSRTFCYWLFQQQRDAKNLANPPSIKSERRDKIGVKRGEMLEEIFIFANVIELQHICLNKQHSLLKLKEVVQKLSHQFPPKSPKT